MLWQLLGLCAVRHPLAAQFEQRLPPLSLVGAGSCRGEQEGFHLYEGDGGMVRGVQEEMGMMR